ncbi:MAG: CDGSH iron-sulfur domain-containing protein [Bacteroidales bacterium]|nr:CDGSH iron-sulfur domain-containing protein [Bacteroidales bacterium]
MEEEEKIKPQAVIEILDDGPLVISGNFILKDLKRETESTPGEVKLCLCGKTSTRPFCDESHNK